MEETWLANIKTLKITVLLRTPGKSGSAEGDHNGNEIKVLIKYLSGAVGIGTMWV